MSGIARRTTSSLPHLTLAFVALTFAVGIGLERLAGVELGTPLPPLLFNVHTDASAWALLAAAVLAGGVALGPRLRALRPGTFALAVGVLALAVRLAVGAARSGPEGWNDAFDESFEAKNEYPEALPALDHGVRFFLDRFAELVPALPVHAAGHPPGLLLTLHVLGIESPNGTAALLIAVGVLAVPLTYALGRRVLDDGRARTAALLSAFASGTTLYGVTSGDALFATLGTAAAALLLGARPAAGAAATAAGAFFSYALPATAAWAVLVRLARRGVRDAAVVATLCAVALVALFAALYALTGFELPAVLAATSDVYRVGVASERPYAYWLFGSLAAFLAFMGLPITWYLARAVAARRDLALALVAILLISALGGFTKAETERIWLMYVPLACVAAATVLPSRRVPLVLALLALQSLAVELIFGTVW